MMCEHRRVTTLEFVAAMTSALVWPVIALTLVLVFRHSIRGWLAERPTRFRAGPIEAVWDREAAKVGASIDSSPAADALQQKGFEELSPAEVVERAQRDPIGAILDGSRAIEDAVKTKLEAAQILPKTGLGLKLNQAEHAGLITREFAESIHSLRTMRNLVAHRPTEATATHAMEYAILAQAVLIQLRGLSWPDPSRKASYLDLKK